MAVTAAPVFSILRLTGSIIGFSFSDGFTKLPRSGTWRQASKVHPWTTPAGGDGLCRSAQEMDGVRARHKYALQSVVAACCQESCREGPYFVHIVNYVQKIVPCDSSNLRGLYEDLEKLWLGPFCPSYGDRNVQNY